MHRNLLFVFCVWLSSVTPLLAAPEVIRYEADVQTITIRKVGGEDRQVIESSRRIVELSDGLKRTTDTSADETRIMEVRGAKVTVKTIRDGRTTTDEFDGTKLLSKLDKVSKGTESLSISERVRRLTGIDVEFDEEKVIGNETYAGYPCTIKDLRLTIKGEKNQHVVWVPKDEEIRKAFECLQRYSYRIIGEGGWLEHAEVIQNIKRIEK